MKRSPKSFTNSRPASLETDKSTAPAVDIAGDTHTICWLPKQFKAHQRQTIPRLVSDVMYRRMRRRVLTCEGDATRAATVKTPLPDVVLPKRHMVAPPTNPLPRIVTDVPPADGPLGGRSDARTRPPVQTRSEWHCQCQQATGAGCLRVAASPSAEEAAATAAFASHRMAKSAGAVIPPALRPIGPPLPLPLRLWRLVFFLFAKTATKTLNDGHNGFPTVSFIFIQTCRGFETPPLLYLVLKNTRHAHSLCLGFTLRKRFATFHTKRCESVQISESLKPQTHGE